MKLVRMCKRGHDKDSVGVATDGHCNGCKKITQKRYAGSIKGKILERNKRYKLLGIHKADGSYFTANDYDVEFIAQSGLCMLCGKNPDSKRLSVDHNHQTGVFRGLLCSICNRYRLPVLEAGTEYYLKVLAYLAQEYNSSKNTRPVEKPEDVLRTAA